MASASRQRSVRGTNPQNLRNIRNLNSGEYEFSLLEKIFNVYRTVLEMMRDRGYNIEQYESFLISRDLRRDILDFRQHFEELSRRNETTFLSSLNNTFSKDDRSPSSDLRIFFPESRIDKGEPKVGKDQIKPITDYLQKHAIRNVIIITQVIPSSSAIPTVDEYPGIDIQHFTYDELSYNLTKHFLVPRHHLLSEEEIRKLSEVDEVPLSKLPIISTLDPVSKYYGAQQGDVFRIERSSVLETTMIGYTVSYRQVANVPLVPATQKDPLKKK